MIFLNTNENVIKEILPEKSFFFSNTEKARVIFSLFFFGVSIIFLLNMNGVLIFFAPIMFAVSLYFLIFRWVFRYHDLQNQFYLITNQRVIVANKVSNKIVKQLTLDEIPKINIEMNSKFFGNIIFGEPEGIFNSEDSSFFLSKSTGMNFTEDKYIFRSVKSIDEIIPIFEKLNLKVSKVFF